MNENVSHSLIKVANQMFFQHLITRPSNVLPVSAAATLALFSSFSVAQEADKSLVAFDPIVVTATRTENRYPKQHLLWLSYPTKKLKLVAISPFPRRFWKFPMSRLPPRKIRFFPV